MPSLPVVEPVVQEGACCAACAAQQPGGQQPAGATTSRAVRRAGDRETTFLGLLVAAGFVVLATGSAGITLLRGGAGPWAPLHLLLAGAAGTAIAAVLPFFTTALAQVAPIDRRVRIGGIGLVAGAALAVTIGVSTLSTLLAGIGGCAYLIGLGLVAIAAFVPLRHALGRRSGVVPMAYGMALAQVAVGVSLATALMLGWGPVVERWAQLKPAHAWLNVFGFLSVVVAATLVHLAPTVAGTRIRRRRGTTLALVSMTVAPPLVAIGFGVGSNELARLGAALEIVGAAALMIQALAVQRARGRWTSDLPWHRFTSFSLSLAPAWFLVAVVIASGRILALGAVPEAWSATLLGIPLALGWTAQVLVGSWTHLIPAVGPGDLGAHAMQRQRLGRWGVARVAVWNVSVAALTLGVVARIDLLVAGAIAMLGGCLVVAIGLLAGSIATRGPRSVTVR